MDGLAGTRCQLFINSLVVFRWTWCVIMIIPFSIVSVQCRHHCCVTVACLGSASVFGMNMVDVGFALPDFLGLAKIVIIIILITRRRKKQEVEDKENNTDKDYDNNKNKKKTERKRVRRRAYDEPTRR